jgi:cell division protein FtsN
MPIMVTFHAGRIALIAAVASLAAGCSREQQDWRSAEGADTTEAWGRFIEQHPASELAPQARSRVAQLAEARDWQHAESIATADAYHAFLAQHSGGKHAEEARIRIEAFSLGSAPRIELQTRAGAEASSPSAGVRALQLATAAAPPAPPQPDPEPLAQPRVLAAPGEAAQLPSPANDAPAAGAASTGAVSTYGVQLGAFGSPASADREWQRLQGRFGTQLGGLSPRIIPASTNSGQLYRLQAPASGEAQARAICDSLKEQAQACVPVLPQ